MSFIHHSSRALFFWHCTSAWGIIQSTNPKCDILCQVKWAVEQFYREGQPATTLHRSCKGYEGEEPKARWQRSGDGAPASPILWGDQAHPPGPGAASTGTVLVLGCLPCPELLAQWCWSHSAQAVARGACWHTTGSCSCSYCGIYCILMQLHKGSCDLLGSLQCSLLLSVVCRQSRIVFHVPHTQLTAFDSRPALSSQFSSRDVSSSNNVEKSVTLGKTPRLLTDQSLVSPDRWKYLRCKQAGDSFPIKKAAHQSKMLHALIKAFIYLLHLVTNK